MILNNFETWQKYHLKMSHLTAEADKFDIQRLINNLLPPFTYIFHIENLLLSVLRSVLSAKSQKYFFKVIWFVHNFVRVSGGVTAFS